MISLQILYCLVSLVLLFTKAETDSEVEKNSTQPQQRTEHPDKAKCYDFKNKYLIMPGKSFGNLPMSMHEEYLKLKCYRFFCEQNSMAGRGVFDCVPLISRAIEARARF